MQTQQTILATMSLGPVGIADQLSAPPDDPSATITSNKTLVMGTCSTDGSILELGLMTESMPDLTTYALASWHPSSHYSLFPCPPPCYGAHRPWSNFAFGHAS